MNTSVKLMYWLNKSKMNKMGLAPIFLRITSNKNRKVISTGIYISIRDWDSKKTIIKGSIEDIKVKNRKLKILLSQVEVICNDFNQLDIPLCAEQIKSRLIKNSNSIQTILEFEYQMLKDYFVAFTRSPSTSNILSKLPVT